MNQIRRLLSPTRHLINLTKGRSDCTVQAGPFKGMVYAEEAVGSAYIPKLLGIYEKELHPVIESAIARVPKFVVDVGAAEGYYAVGLAKRLPASQVVSFEATERGRASIEAMARRNGVSDRLISHGFCDLGSLRDVLSDADGVFLLMDVEGFESELLVPSIRAILARCELLIEMHDFLSPGVTQQALELLGASHDIEIIPQTPRSSDDFPYSSLYLKMLPERYRYWAVDESRQESMHWLHCLPKT